MTRDEVIRLAKPYQWLNSYEGWTFNSYEKLFEFAELVAAEEREACYNALQKVIVTDHSLRTYKRCLDAIQKLGETKSDAAMEKVK